MQRVTGAVQIKKRKKILDVDRKKPCNKKNCRANQQITGQRENYTYKLPEGQFTSAHALDSTGGLGPGSHGQDVIWGSLIADGYSNPRGCVTLDHSVSSAPYVYWKWQCLAADEMITLKSTPRLCTRLDRRSGTWTYSLRFNSLTLFYSERQLLYVPRAGKKGKSVKSFPTLKKSASRWTPAALAVWYMDDGGRGGNSKRGCVIDVSCYAPHGLKRIKLTLRKIYQIETSFQRGSGKTVKLFILEKSAVRFRDLVAPYIIPSMWYKVSHLYS